MRHNGGRKPDEILAEIDRTRGEMDRTLSAIEHRLTLLIRLVLCAERGVR